MEGLWQDARYALRTLRRTPVFTTVAILTLALGIGANTAIFSLIDTLMLRALPVRAPEELVELVSRYPGEPDNNGFSLSVYEQFRDQNHVFANLVGLSPARVQVSGDRLAAETLDGAYVTGSLFPALGVQPAIGRLLGVDDDRPGAAGVAVVSWSYWRRMFDHDPHIVGSPVTINGAPATIVGVTPREFFGLQVGMKPDVWMPISSAAPAGRRLSDQFGVGLMARLKPGVSIAQARADMAVLNRARVEELARISTNPVWRQATLGVEPANAGFSMLRSRYGKPLLMLMTLVALLLLLASANLASLLLARSAARQREMAIRVAIGAGRLRLVRQTLTEALSLSIAGAVPGIALAYVGAGALARIVASGSMLGLRGRITLDVRPDGRVLLFALVVTTVTGVLFGLAPAWQAFALAPASAIRESATIGETRSHRAFGQTLVIAQVALSVVLLSAAALFVDHLSTLRSVGLGFDRRSLLLVTLDPQGAGYNNTQLTSLYEQLLARLHAIPGVHSATLSAVTPVEGGGAARFARVEGSRERPEDRRYLSLNWVGPRYFETLGTPLIAGRDFEFADAGRPRVAIVSQSLAKHYFGDASPLGKHLTFDGDDLPYEIVGLAGDSRYLNLYRSPPMVYMNAFQEGHIASKFSLRTSVPPERVAGEVRRAVSEVLKTVTVAKVTTMTEQMDASIVTERLIATLSGAFGVLGTVLAATGLYGLLAYSVARRTSEIGVRMALGATRGDVTGMVLKRAVGLAAAGLAIGVPIAIWSRRLAINMLEGLSLDTLFPIVVAMAVMLAVACLAAYVPARRAARVNPVEALRHW
jgi:predicted permease